MAAPLPDLKLRTQVSLPAAIDDGVAIKWTKEAGRYQADLDWTDINQLPSVPVEEQSVTMLPVVNSLTKVFSLIPFGVTEFLLTGTSTTSLTIGTGSKSASTQAGIGWTVGTRLRYADADDPTKYMEGVVTDYNSGTGAVTVNFDTVHGSGTIANWAISIAAEPSPVYEAATYAAAIALSPTIGITKIRISDSGAEFVYRASAPSHLGYLTTANGRIYELVNLVVYPDMLGAVGDGVFAGDVMAGFTLTGTDDKTALRAWASIPGRYRRLNAKVYCTSGTITLLPGDSIMGIAGSSWIAGLAGGTWTTGGAGPGALVDCVGSLVALPNLSVDSGRAARTLALASAPTINANDVVVIYDPTDYSWTNQTALDIGGWGNDRPYYRDGEMIRIIGKTGSTVTLQTPVRSSTNSHYDHTVVRLFRMPEATITISGVGFHAPYQNGAMALNISFMTSVRMQSVIARNSNVQSLQMDRCFDIDGTSMSVSGFAADGVTPVYGLVFSNCQKGNIQGIFAGTWHALGMGVNDASCCVPTRDIVIRDSYISAQFVTGSDEHGASQNIAYENCTINNGAALGGDGARYTNCRIVGGSVNGGVVAIASEIIGGVFEFNNCDFVTEGDPTGGRGVIEFGGNTAAVTKNAKREVTLIIKNCRLAAGSVTSTTPAIRVGVVGTVSAPVLVPLNIIVDGFDGPSQLDKVVQYAGFNSTAKARFITVKGITGFASGAVLNSDGGSFTDSGTFYDLQEQSGIQNLTTANGTAGTSHASENFRYAYGFSPHVQVSLGNDSFDGSKPVIPRLYSKSATSVQTGARVYDNSAFSGTATLTVHWTARVIGMQGPT